MPDAAQDVPQDRAIDAARVPALAGLGAVMAVLDLVVRRGIARLVGDAVPHAERLAFEPYMRSLMNGVALASTIATFDAMAALLRKPDAASLPRRISMGVLMMMFLPCTALSTFLPTEHTTVYLVLLASMLAHVFAAQLALGAFEHRANLAMRLASVGVFAACVGAIVSFTLTAFGPAMQWAPSYEVSRAARAIGEVGWAMAPVCAFVALVRRDPKRLLSVRSAVAGAVVLVAVILFMRARAHIGSEYVAVLYGALHLQILAGITAFPYALVFGVALGATVHGALSRDGIDRQLGYGAAFLLAAGFSPNAPLLLALLVCAATLFARALFAEAEARAEAAFASV